MKKTTQKKLSAFIIAAMMFSVNAYSQIVYTDIIPDSTLAGNYSYNLDLNNDGIPDFLIAHTSSGYFPHLNSYTRITPQNGSKCSAQKRAAGDIISSPLSYSAAGNQIMYATYWTRGEAGYVLHFTGTWNGSGTGYLALKLVVGGNTYFGWARLGPSAIATFAIKDYGYNSIPNQPILAGETSCATPTVNLTQSGPLSFCAGDSVTLTANGTGYLYQWKSNGVNITGSTFQSYVAKTPGTYKCKVTNSCGSKTSGGKTVTIPCRMPNENFEEPLNHLSVFPNPATNSVTINFPSDEEGTIQIVNLFGQIVFSEKIFSEEANIDVTKFSKGMYAVRWSSKMNNETKTFSVVK